MKNTLFITDLDGTLLNDNSKLSQHSIDIINDLIAKGVYFTYATASAFARSSIKAEGINWSLPIITYNGAITLDPKSGDVIKSFTMKKENIKDIINTLQDLLIYPLVYSISNKKETVKWIKGKENIEMSLYLNSIENSDKIKLYPVSNYDELFKDEIFYITHMCDKQEMDRIKDYFNNTNDYNVTKVQDSANKNLFWLEIFDRNARKDLAILELKDLIKADRLISFGDNLNDIPMFDVSNECYLVSNANEEMKKKYKSVIDSNENDGVAIWLQNYYNTFNKN